MQTTHSFSATTRTDRTHSHAVNGMGRAGGGNTSTNPLSWGTAVDDGELAVVKGGNGSIDLSAGVFPGGEHTHTISGITENNSVNHTHSVPNHTHTITGLIGLVTGGVDGNAAL